MTEPTWYQQRYAIRLPDGNLAISPFGEPWNWEDRAKAERAIEYFRLGAERVGVHDWNGEIVRQLCTPWIGDRDRYDHLIDELNRWLDREIGGQP